MKKVGFIYDEFCLRHELPVWHPDSKDRLAAIRAVLMSSSLWPDLIHLTPRRAGYEDIARVHTPEYIDKIRNFGAGELDPDTFLSADSCEAALHAAGAVMEAVDQCLKGTIERAFCAIRPPGHHAEANQGMGFCIFNNVAVGARYARTQGYERVFIIDFDAHHGNGTQHIFEEDDTVFYFSTHQWPWYPGTGAAEERGVGNVFNVPRGPGHPPELYVGDLWAAVVAATTDWTPDFTLISAGFDAMRGDPLGGFTLEPGHYADLTHRLRERFPDTPIVGVLEGGYIPERLAEGAAAHVLALV